MKSLIVGDKPTVQRLADRLKRAGSHSEYQRIQCVLIRVTLGSSAAEIAQLLGWSTATVHVLHSRWAKEGEAIFGSDCAACHGATLGGNLGTGSPIGDAAPVLLALDASVVLASTDGDRTVPLADYFTGYRESVRRPGELIREVVVPLPASGLTAFHKIAKRRFDDISSVAVGFALDV